MSAADQQCRLPAIRHHGAARGVTGSCHRLEAFPDCHVLIDCGLFQGRDAGKDSLARHRIEFDLSMVQALVITHVHIDHVGRLPYLLAAGYGGPIICSVPTARLLPLVIEDALEVGFTRDRALIERFLERVESHLVPLEYGQWHRLWQKDGRQVDVRLQRAGHILGSAYVELDSRNAATGYRDRTVFSGDLGAPHAPLLPAPDSPEQADTVVIESTYGGRRHEDRRTRRKRLQTVLERSLRRGGTVMIPAFSIGRTQELLYELEEIIHEQSSHARQQRNNPHADVAGEGQEASKTGAMSAVDWSYLQIIVDSPLAARFTAVYRSLREWWDVEALERVRAGRHPLDFETLYTVGDHETHERTVRYLSEQPQPSVVIAASGMAAGGRIVNYLKAMLGDARHSVLFVGFQAPGTPGEALQRVDPERDPGASVELDGQRVPVRASIATIGGYSAHADGQDLLRFVSGIRPAPGRVRLVHGTPEAQRKLQQTLGRVLSADSRIERAAEE